MGISKQMRHKRWLSLAVDVFREVSGKQGAAVIALPTDIGEALILEGVLFRREGSVWFAHLDGTEVEAVLGGNGFVININD